MNFALTYIYDTGDNATYLYKSKEAAEKDFKDSFFSAVKEAGENRAIEVQCEAKDDHWYIECLYPDDDFSRAERIDCYLTPIYYNEAEEAKAGEEG